jgi:hypothetical protein
MIDFARARLASTALNTAKLLQLAADFRHSWLFSPLPFHLASDLTQALHGDICLSLAAILAPVAVDVRAVDTPRLHRQFGRPQRLNSRCNDPIVLGNVFSISASCACSCLTPLKKAATFTALAAATVPYTARPCANAAVDPATFALNFGPAVFVRVSQSLEPKRETDARPTVVGSGSVVVRIRRIVVRIIVVRAVVDVWPIVSTVAIAVMVAISPSTFLYVVPISLSALLGSS